MIRQETLYTEQQKRSGSIFQQSDLVEEFSDEELENLLSELSDEDLGNIAGGFATSVIDPSRIYLTITGRITALQQHAMPPYGVLPYRMAALTR
jgi:hypothetical protein